MIDVEKLRGLPEKLREQAHEMESPYYTKTPDEPDWDYVAKAFKEIVDYCEAAGLVELLADYERLLRERDDERLRALNEAARAQCEFCAQGLAVQPKGDDPFLDGKLWHVDGGIFRICRASAIRAIAAEQPPAVSEPVIEDGFGNVWSARCPDCGELTMVVVRPGKVQCVNPQGCPPAVSEYHKGYIDGLECAAQITEGKR